MSDHPRQVTVADLDELKSCVVALQSREFDYAVALAFQHSTAEEARELRFKAIDEFYAVWARLRAEIGQKAHAPDVRLLRRPVGVTDHLAALDG